MMARVMQDAFSYCAELVRNSDRDRFIATLFAPAQRRGGLHALYAFSLEVARVRDLAREAMPGEIRLQWWREVLQRQREGEASSSPIAVALLSTIEAYRLPVNALLMLIEARRFDLYNEPMVTIAQLEDYAINTSSALIDMAAQVLGYDKPDPSQLYNLTDDQLAAVRKKLIELKPNVRKMWATGGELTNLFQNHEVVAAMGWPLMTNQLRQLHFPIGETIPKENTTGWIDHLMISAGSSRKELATQFLEYMIEAQTQKKITDVTHYTPANPGASQFLTLDEIKGLHLDNPDAYMQRIYFWQDVPRRAKYNEIWNEVKAAQ